MNQRPTMARKTQSRRAISLVVGLALGGCVSTSKVFELRPEFIRLPRQGWLYDGGSNQESCAG